MKNLHIYGLIHLIANAVVRRDPIETGKEIAKLFKNAGYSYEHILEILWFYAHQVWTIEHNPQAKIISRPILVNYVASLFGKGPEYLDEEIETWGDL